MSNLLSLSSLSLLIISASALSLLNKGRFHNQNGIDMNYCQVAFLNQLFRLILENQLLAIFCMTN